MVKKPARPVSLRLRQITRERLRECAALGWYADRWTTDRLIREALMVVRRRLHANYKRRGLDPETALAGLRGPQPPMPDLYRPRPAVDD